MSVSNSIKSYKWKIVIITRYTHEPFKKRWFTSFFRSKARPLLSYVFFSFFYFWQSEIEQWKEKGQSSHFFLPDWNSSIIFSITQSARGGLWAPVRVRYQPTVQRRSNTHACTHKHTLPPLHPPLCVSHWDILFRASSVVFAGADGTHYLCMLSAPWIFTAFIFRRISTAACVFSPQLFLPATCRDPHRATLQPLKQYDDVNWEMWPSLSLIKAA